MEGVPSHCARLEGPPPRLPPPATMIAVCETHACGGRVPILCSIMLILKIALGA